MLLHEFGHFFFARLFKTRVEKFYLFFDPWFSLFKFKKGDTEYGLGWLPLGGYVKISGMIDESMDKEQMKEEPKPWEFRSKPAWQRLLIMVGGVLVNFLLAIFIFWMILYKWGETYIPAENAKYGYVYNPIAEEIGLQDGDKILAVGDFKIETIGDITYNLLLEDVEEITVQRGESIFNLDVPKNFSQKIIAQQVGRFVDYRMPTIVSGVIDDNGGNSKQLLPGDSIVAVNNISTPYFHEFSREVMNLSNKTVLISLYRDRELLHKNLSVDENGKIGFYPVSPLALFGYETVSFSFFEAMPAGVNKGVKMLTDYVKQMKLVFTKEGAKQVGGFGAIGNLFPPVWDWQSFWFTTAFLSIILAFMNILPIPALDGGHVLFLLYEIVVGRKPSDKFMEYAITIGLILLFSLLIYANGNDIYRLFFK